MKTKINLLMYFKYFLACLLTLIISPFLLAISALSEKFDFSFDMNK